MKRLIAKMANGLLVGLFIIMGICLMTGVKVNAKTYKLHTNSYGGSCSAVVVKNKIYYGVTETGTIWCYDIKSGKTKEIVSKNGKGFYMLKKKGGYLYAVYDNYGGSDGSDDYIVRVNIKSGKVQTLAKGTNFVIKKNTIYFTKAERVKNKYNEYDKTVGVYSMKLDGSGQKACPDVSFDVSQPKKIKNSKGSLVISGKSYTADYFSADKLIFNPKKGKKRTIYNLKKDKNAPEYMNIGYCTLQGNYIIYKTGRKSGKYGTESILVVVKTNGKGKKTFYSRVSVSGW